MIEREGGLGLLFLHNPRLRNALTEEVVSQLRTALIKLSQDDQLRALIIGSAVEGVFVSGGNIRELHALAGCRGGLQFAEAMQAVFKMIEDFSRPVLVVINGYCLGAGAELAMAADIRIASDSAVFASPQLSLGIIPGLGGGQRMIRLSRVGQAKRLVLTGERIGAAEALRLGLVECVTPAHELWDVAKSIARRLCSKPRSALALAKRALNYSSQANLKAGCAYEAGQFGLACQDAWTGRPIPIRLRDAGECS
jgi:enoyl-CoA hydratase